MSASDHTKRTGVGNEYTAASEKDAVRRACQDLMIESKLLRYEVVEIRKSVTKWNGRGGPPAQCRIRITDVLPWSALQEPLSTPDDADHRIGAEADAAGPPERGPRGDRRRPREEGAGDKGSRSRSRGAEKRDSHHNAPRSTPAPRQPMSPALEPDILTRAQNTTREILRLMGMAAEVKGTESADAVSIEIDAKDNETRTLLDATVLASLQLLVQRIAFPSWTAGSKALVLDAGGTMERREALLSAMGVRLGQKAKTLGSRLAVYPLPSSDRRIVHQAISEQPGVSSESQGNGNFRRLVIVPQS